MPRKISGSTTVMLGAAGIALLGGLAVAVRSPAPRPDPPSGPGSTVERYAEQWRPEIARLEEALARERTERTALTAEVRRLREQMEEVEARAERLSIAARRAAASEGTSSASAATSTTAADNATKPAGIDTEAIVAAGFARDEVQAFRTRLDHIELERLYLHDVAAREGWVDSPRFRQENTELSDALEETRGEYSDELYDWMLYAGGHPNRVGVAEVMAGSAAAEAGMRAGDVILRYDDAQIFGVRDLRDATRTGIAGDPTSVTVDRDGREIQVSVPRGPLGVRLDPRAAEPPPAR
jgi:hypothetical protein